MESRNMSEKEFQEFQKLLQRELGSAEPAKEDEEIAEMLRRDNRPARTVPPRYRQPAEPQTEPIQEPEPEMEPETEPQTVEAFFAEQQAAPVTRGKYERVPEEDGNSPAQSRFSLPAAEDMPRKRGKYEKVSPDEEPPEGDFEPTLPEETAAQRRQRAQRHARITRLVVGLAIVFVIGLGAGLIVNTLQSKKPAVTSDEALSVQTGVTDEQGNLISDGAQAECNILGLAPIQNYISVLEGDTRALQISMTTKGAASAADLQWETSDPAVAKISEDGKIMGVGAGECIVTVSAKENPTISAQVRCVVRHIEEKDGATYVDDILVINKTYPADASFNPGFQEVAADAFAQLQADAQAQGLDIYDSSDYRDYDYQNTIYHNYVEIYGWEMADTFSARPGFSEHQTGLVIDVNSIDDAFGETQEAQWLKEHCADYGFIIRYPEDKVDITGYKYEPWHIRYVGVEIAKEMQELGLCLEEYLGITSQYAEDWTE